MQRFKLILIFGLVCWVAGCYPTPGPDKTIAGAVLGAGWGAGAGAIIGNQTNATPEGAGLGATFGFISGISTGIGFDIAEQTELEHQRQLDALKVQVASNQRSLLLLQNQLDQRDARIRRTNVNLQIYFDPDRASLRMGSSAQLQQLANAVKLNPYYGHVIVHGHTDDSGNLDTNLRLSEARARTVTNFLASQGISLDQIKMESHGATRALATNETEAGRQLNRRVEVILTK